MAPPTPEIVRAQLNRVLADPRFTRSERHSRFLRYSVEKTLAGKGDELKEYVIAMEVYGKPASYDPSVDSIVRVDAARLRSKLLDYYTTNGRDDAVRFEFPRGSYAPVFTAQGSPAGPVPPSIPVLEENAADVTPLEIGQPPPRFQPAVRHRRHRSTGKLHSRDRLAAFGKQIDVRLASSPPFDCSPSFRQLQPGP